MFRVFLAPFTPLLGDLPYEYISVLENRENLSKLIRRIEELRDKIEEEKKKKKKVENMMKDKDKKRWYQLFGLFKK